MRRNGDDHVCGLNAGRLGIASLDTVDGYRTRIGRADAESDRLVRRVVEFQAALRETARFRQVLRGDLARQAGVSVGFEKTDFIQVQPFFRSDLLLANGGKKRICNFPRHDVAEPIPVARRFLTRRRSILFSVDRTHAVQRHLDGAIEVSLVATDQVRPAGQGSRVGNHDLEILPLGNDFRRSATGSIATLFGGIYRGLDGFFFTAALMVADESLASSIHRLT